MKILLVSSTILPQRGGSSVIVENLARNFSKEQMLVLGSKGLFGKNHMNRDPAGPEFRYFFSELSIFGRGARFFDWFRRRKMKPLIKAMEKIIRQENITYVIGVYPNQFYCVAAARAAKQAGVPFSSYFHNTYEDNPGLNDPDASQWQKEIFDHSQYIFVMSDGLKEFYERKHPGKTFIPLVHTFKEFPDASKNSGLPGPNKDIYKLVAIGNFNPSNMEATIRFLEAVASHPKYELSIYTHVPGVLLNHRGLNTSLFDHKPAVWPDEIHAELQHFDICVLTHGFHGAYGPIEYETIFPTRTIPFLLSGKPIFAHSPEGSFLNKFLIKNQCAELVAEPDVSKIIEGLERIADNREHQEYLVSNAYKTAQLFHGPKVAEQLLNTLS